MKVLDNDQWVEKQFSSCQLGNSLRTKRLQKVATQMLNQPEQSLCKQNPLWADLKAAYRLFDKQPVTFDAVAEQHWQQTRRTKPGRYLLISDTTDIDHFSHRATTGLAQLGKGDGRSQSEAKAATHVPSSWLKCLKLARPKLKLTGMSVYTFFRELAKLGGFLGRKGDGEPGWQTVWHGYKRLHALLDGTRLVRAI